MKFENPRVDGMSPSKVMVIVLYIKWFGEKGWKRCDATGLDWLNNQKADGRFQGIPKEPQSPWSVNGAHTSKGPIPILESHLLIGQALGLGLGTCMSRQVGNHLSNQIFRTRVNVLIAFFLQTIALHASYLKMINNNNIITLHFYLEPVNILKIGADKPSTRRTSPIKILVI